MSLKDLAKHINDQEGAINKLPSEVISKSDSSTLRWEGVRSSFWGKGLESVQWEEDVTRGSDPVEDVALPDQRVVATFPPILAPKTPNILVRSQYSAAEQRAVLASESLFVFMVSGQPGVGKSTFLRWLLLRRLALKLPTAYQFTSGYALLFCEGGTFELTQLDDRASYMDLCLPVDRRIWALVDSSPVLPKPAPIFQDESPFFVVNAASPRSEYLDWLNKVGPRRFYMSPWSISEVLQARQFFSNNPTERQLKKFYDDFSTSPGDLAEFSCHSDEYSVTLERMINKMEPGQLRQAIQNPGSLDFSHLIVTIWPVPPDQFSFVVQFASKHIARLLWAKHIHSQVDEMRHLYNLFSANDVTAASAGWTFEFRMHELLRCKQTLKLFPILRSSNRGLVNLIYDNYTATLSRKNAKTFKLLASAEYPLIEGARLDKGHYYRPEASNFPEIDSLLLIHPALCKPPVLLMFQMTLDKEVHEVKFRGLQKVDDLDFFPGAQRYYVVVTPEKIRPKITVPIEYFEGKEVDKTLKVFHYPIGSEDLFPQNM